MAAAGQAGSGSALVAGRAEQLPFPDATFDALTFTYLLRYVEDPQATLAELARVVKPGGTWPASSSCAPPARSGGPAWWAYTRLAAARGRAADSAAGSGTGWAASSARTSPAHYRATRSPGRPTAGERAGLRDVGVRVMSLGGGLVMWGTRAGD